MRTIGKQRNEEENKSKEQKNNVTHIMYDIVEISRRLPQERLHSTTLKITSDKRY